MRGELKREMEPYSILSKGGKALHTYRSLGQMAEDFFLCLSMAHECLREYDEKLGKDVYQGPSPDEITLVDAARLMGFKYLTSSSAGIKVEVKGKPAEYDLLELFPFNSDRKRMSIVVRINGVLRMFTKGADSIIKRRLTSTPAPFLAGIEEYLTQFSRIGLRTLLIATKVVEEEEYR